MRVLKQMSEEDAGSILFCMHSHVWLKINKLEGDADSILFLDVFTCMLGKKKVRGRC